MLSPYRGSNAQRNTMLSIGAGLLGTALSGFNSGLYDSSQKGAQLLLEGAARSVSDALTSSKTKSTLRRSRPLLVGVETNPGPRARRSRRKSKKRIGSSSSAPPQALTNYSTVPMSSLLMGGAKNNVFRVSNTFKLGNIYNYTGVYGNSYVALNRGQAGTTGSPNISSQHLFNPEALGIAPFKNLGNSFEKWRVVDMRIRYVPLCPTTQTGAFQFAFIPEAGYFNTSSTLGVGSAQNCIESPPYLPFEYKPSGLDTDWKYTHYDNSVAPASQIDSNLRDCSPGEFALYWPTPATVNTIFGSIWIDCILEFKDMVNEDIVH